MKRALIADRGFRSLTLSKVKVTAAVVILTYLQAGWAQDSTSSSQTKLPEMPAPATEPAVQPASEPTLPAADSNGTPNQTLPGAAPAPNEAQPLPLVEPATSGAAPDSGLSKASSNLLKDKRFQPDEEITDLRLRAEAGSLSRYSIKANLDYSGPTINDFSNPDQPNPDHTIGLHKTSARGQIGARFRIDKDQAVNFGTGLTAVTPTYGYNRTDVNTPYLSYDITRKFGKVQARLAPTASLITQPETRNVGEVATTGFNAGAVYNIGYSRWALSTDFNSNYAFYNRMYRMGVDKQASAMDFGIYPGMKYNISDNVNFALSVGVAYYSPRVEQDLTHILHKTINSRFGVGWAVRRDIYIYPYLTFYPTQLEPQMTQFNLSTVFSVL